MVNSRDSLDLAPFTSPAAGPVEWLISDAPVGYEEALAAMEVRAAAIARGEASELVWLLEHPPLYTAGTSTGGTTPATPFPMFETGRGGQVTYHGPGQIVAYPLLDLRRLKIGVRDYVHRIEQAIIDTLARYSIAAVRRDGAPGVYVDDAKVAALGIRVRRGCTFHGLAFNIAMDLEPFARINPCGYAGLAVTSVVDLGGPASMETVKPALLAELARQFDLALETATEPPPSLQLQTAA